MVSSWSGTAEKFGMRWIGCELNEDYANIAIERITGRPVEVEVDNGGGDGEAAGNGKVEAPF
jgi:hypothetical protein